MISNLRFHNGGYCWQNTYFTGVPSIRFRKFQAVFISFQHSRFGNCLIDTGYGPQIFEATRKFPYRLLRWATPIPKKQSLMQPRFLIDQGIEPQQIDLVFLSHFHADHIGASKAFPNARFVCRTDPLRQLLDMEAKKQIDHGFVPDLLPHDFMNRLIEVPESSFELSLDRFDPFLCSDFWEDESLILIDLPGHAMGHTGYYIRSDTGPVLYVVDAFWDRNAWISKRRLPFFSRRFQHDYAAYESTLNSLHSISKHLNLTPLACHCPETQTHVE
ncbi:MAG: MBL fold metallo-hydrolase [Planctomycetota bacterium]